MIKTILKCGAVAAFTMSLVSCGGGKTTVRGVTPEIGEGGEPPLTPQSAFSTVIPQTADVAYGTAARNPFIIYGHVTHVTQSSSNGDAVNAVVTAPSGAPGDVVESLQIELGGALSLSSADNGRLEESEARSSDTEWHTVHYLEGSSSNYALVEVSYYSQGGAFASDWLAGGVWVDDTGSDLRIGAFADGGDAYGRISRITPETMGTYTSDKVLGIYSDGAGNVMDFTASIALTVSFTSFTIQGEVNTFMHDGENLDGVDTLTLMNIGVGESDDGSLFSGQISVPGDDSSYFGSWGGRFYGGAPPNRPLHTAGTFAASTGTEANSKSIVGAFIADLQ